MQTIGSGSFRSGVYDGKIAGLYGMYRVTTNNKTFMKILCEIYVKYLVLRGHSMIYFSCQF